MELLGARLPDSPTWEIRILERLLWHTNFETYPVVNAWCYKSELTWQEGMWYMSEFIDWCERNEDDPPSDWIDTLHPKIRHTEWAVALVNREDPLQSFDFYHSFINSEVWILDPKNGFIPHKFFEDQTAYRGVFHEETLKKLAPGYEDVEEFGDAPRLI